MSGKKYTTRDFGLWEIPVGGDDYDPVGTFQVQESSLATERRCWIGLKGTHRLHATVEEARRIRDALTEWLGDES